MVIVALKFIRFRNKIDKLLEKLVRNQTLQQYFARNCLFELTSIKQTKCNNIKTKIERLIDEELDQYTSDISNLEAKLNALRHKRALKFIRFRNKIEKLRERLVKTQTLQKYFERNNLFELTAITQAKCNNINNKIYRLSDTSDLYYLEAELRELRHHREVIKQCMKENRTGHIKYTDDFTKYHVCRRQRKCAWGKKKVIQESSSEIDST